MGRHNPVSRPLTTLSRPLMSATRPIKQSMELSSHSNEESPSRVAYLATL